MPRPFLHGGPNVQFVFTVATLPCLTASFQIQAFFAHGRTSSKALNAMDVEETRGPQESGSVYFEIMVESRVVLDVHAIV